MSKSKVNQLTITNKMMEKHLWYNSIVIKVKMNAYVTMCSLGANFSLHSFWVSFRTTNGADPR